MKKILLALLIGLFLAGCAATVADVVEAADGDITKVEVIPDTAKYVLDTVVLRAIDKSALVIYRKVDSDGNKAGDEVDVLFKNQEDNPDTPEDETSTEFTQLIALINNNSNIKTSITTAVKVKLGIE